MFELRAVTVKRERDADPDVSFLEPDSGRYDDVVPASEREKYRRQDAERLAAFNRDEWHMTGVSAVAEIAVSIHASTHGVIRIQSGGLWGIESDSEESYFAEIGQEQLDELARLLDALGATAGQLEEVRKADAAPAEYV